MEQIYYTQCPVGYGLGASNGFQVKRLSRGYPMSSDFRHLGMKAFPGGGRTLAPPALRYRRDGEIAEVAWLTPRANEYETERGLWGRPGGHFAHGLRLGPEELKAIKRWPAGLFDSKVWVRSDREPSRGRLPDDVELAPSALFRPPSFAEVAPLADGHDPDRLAILLTAVAKVTLEGRTLFVIDEPGRLGPLVALLTFAFPERLRDDLTFSTYHDRPEELPGFRISGTIPPARPNKLALTAQGVVADLTLGGFEPRIEPAAWARTLAGWLIRHDPVDEADWSATDARARAARKPIGQESAWSDAWLDSLFSYPAALRSREAPADPAGWAALGEFAGWLHRSRLAEEWVRPRGPGWWLAAADPAKDRLEARDALVAHVMLRDGWRGDANPSSWGEVVATWFREVEPVERDRSIAAVLQSAPRSARPSFAQALLKGLTPEGADAVLRQLRDDPTADRAMLLPLEAGAAVAAVLGGGEPAALGPIIDEARLLPGATSAVLAAIEAGIADRPEALAAFAGLAAPSFDPEGPGEGREGIVWALRRGQLAPAWLEPAIRPILADPGRQPTWLAIRDRTPDDLRAPLARVMLAIAADEGLPDEAFRWGVEGLLLPLAPRPSNPTWAETYLRRNPSGLELLRRLVAPEYRKLGLKDWIAQARERGEVSAEQAKRVDSCLAYAKVLSTRDANGLPRIELPDVPPAERGALLGQMLNHVGGSGLEGLPFVLDAARQAWHGAFDPGAAGLRALAYPLARCLGQLGLPPAPWLARMTQTLERLGLAESAHRGFDPDGLAAEVVAAANRLPDADPWGIRQYLLRHDSAWRILAVDARRDLDEVRTELAAEVLDRWDRTLAQDKPARFFELMLNASAPDHLAILVPARAADLKTLPPMAWWDHGRHPEAVGDLREGYVRTVPLAPIGEGRLFLVRAWVQGPSKSNDDNGSGFLSAKGLARWRCLEALTNFQNVGREPEVRWPIVQGWEADLPLHALVPDDRYRFLAWVVRGLDAAESYQLARLAAWLKKSGMKDPGRLARWADELDGLVEVPDNLKLFRSGMIGELRSELFQRIRDEKEPRGPRPPTPQRG